MTSPSEPSEQGSDGSPNGPDDRPENRPEQGRIARSWTMLKFSSVGIEMSVATLIGWALGYWLDLKLCTYPWLMLVFLLIGVAAGFKGVFRAAREAQEVMGDRPAKSAETTQAASESHDHGSSPPKVP